MSAASNTSKKEALLAPEMTVPTTEASADPGNLLRAARDHRDAAERAARKNGASTVLIDPAFAGTTCATVGCMPSKLLIAAAREAHRIGRAGLFGIDIDAARVDGPAVLQIGRAHV